MSLIWLCYLVEIHPTVWKVKPVSCERIQSDTKKAEWSGTEFYVSFVAAVRDTCNVLFNVQMVQPKILESTVYSLFRQNSLCLRLESPVFLVNFINHCSEGGKRLKYVWWWSTLQKLVKWVFIIYGGVVERLANEHSLHLIKILKQPMSMQIV